LNKAEKMFKAREEGENQRSKQLHEAEKGKEEFFTGYARVSGEV